MRAALRVAIFVLPLCVAAGCSSRSTQFVIDAPPAREDVREAIREADAGRLRFMVMLYASALSMHDYTAASLEPNTVAYWAEGTKHSSAYIGARRHGDRLVVDVAQPSRGLAVWPFARRRVSWSGLVGSLRQNLSAAFHGRVIEMESDARIDFEKSTVPKSQASPSVRLSEGCEPESPRRQPSAV